MADKQVALSPFENPKTLAGAAYLLGGIAAYGVGYGGLSSIISVILPLVIYFAKKDDEFVRFHAFQAFLWSGLLFIVGYVLSLVFLQSVSNYYYGGGFGQSLGIIGLFGIIGLIAIVIDLYLAIKAYNGEKVKLPVLGNYAEKPFL